MDRTELIAAAVHQVWWALCRTVEPWDTAPGWQKSVTYHAVRFLDALDVESYTLEKLIEASAFAWNKYLERSGRKGRLPLVDARVLVITYMVMRAILGPEKEPFTA